MTDLVFTSKTKGKFTLPEAESFVYGVAEKARADWIRLGQSRIRDRRLSSDYVRSIQPVKLEASRDKVTASVSLVDTGNGLVRKVEEGSGPYDMKPGLLAGPKARVGKNGRWTIVPIRHDKPGVGKRAVSTAVYDLVKGGGGRMPVTGPQGSRVRNRVTQLLSKSKRYEGLTERPVAGRGTVLETYRTVSEKSHDLSWMHPGFSALMLAEEVSRMMMRDLSHLIRRM